MDLTEAKNFTGALPVTTRPHPPEAGGDPAVMEACGDLGWTQEQGRLKGLAAHIQAEACRRHGQIRGGNAPADASASAGLRNAAGCLATVWCAGGALSIHEYFAALVLACAGGDHPTALRLTEGGESSVWRYAPVEGRAAALLAELLSALISGQTGSARRRVLAARREPGHLTGGGLADGVLELVNLGDAALRRFQSAFDEAVEDRCAFWEARRAATTPGDGRMTTLDLAGCAFVQAARWRGLFCWRQPDFWLLED